MRVLSEHGRRTFSVMSNYYQQIIYILFFVHLVSIYSPKSCQRNDFNTNFKSYNTAKLGIWYLVFNLRKRKMERHAESCMSYRDRNITAGTNGRN